MKKKRLTNRTLSRWILLLLMLVTVQVLSTPGETGYAAGFAAFWRHEQLPLTMTVADVDDVTESGECLTPTCAISDYDNNGQEYRRLIIAGGTMPTYMIVSLPKGYRITGYKIVLRNDLGNRNVSNSTTQFKLNDSNTLYFYEVDPWTTGSTNYEDASLSTYKEVATASDGSTAINVGTASNQGGSDYGKEYTIQRYSEAEDGSDMSNQLYFRLTKIFGRKYYGISIKSFEIFFTAKGTFTAEGAPSSINPTAVSVLPVAFNTNKTDIGGLKPTTKDNQTFYTYNYRKVTDLLAFNYLYQEDALKEDAEGKKYPEEGDETKKICQVENGGKKYFGLKNGVYYMETPVTVTNSSGEESPIGYRIVGAKINYAYGSDQNGTAARTVNCIKFVDPSDNKEYYLNSDGTYQTTPVEWTADANGIHSGDAYLAYQVTGYGTSTIYRLTVGNSSIANKLTQNDIHGEYIYHYMPSQNSGAVAGDYYLIGLASSTARPPFERLVNNTSDDHYNANLRATWTTATLPATSKFVAEEYQIDVYDYKRGETVQKTIDVTSGTGSYDLGILNNDAIKFEIKGVDGGNGLALVTIDLTLQALNPYINSMEIVCHDGDDNDPTKPRTMEMSQTFTNDDFSVSGGVFEFYVPERYANENLTFTFSNLYSTDGDETYPNGKGAARYSFVTSDYFENFDGNGDDGLYSTSYDPESTAAPFRYEDKAFTAVAGNNFFKFNNADELNSSSTGTHPDHLIEYPFTVSKYLASTGSPTGEGTFTQNEFVDVILNASGTANTAIKNSGIYYVFTADETRYNIAKTTAWEHRYYAFYRMDIDLKAMTYHPELEWTPVYDKTCYYKKVDNKDTDAEDSMWGLKLKTVETAGSNGEVEGFLTTVEIDNAITEALTGSDGNGKPKTTDQILYVDASNLKSVVAIQGTGGLSMETLKAKFAPNVLFYLPEKSTSTLDNFAYKQDDKFYAAGNIVITDRNPFYAPFDIQTTSPNYATYTREISWPRNGKTALATVILPFQLTVRDGVHTEPAGSMYPGSQFTVNKMNSSNCLSIKEEELNSANDYYKADAYFSPISGTSTEANKPYMINVTTAPDNENVPFAATQIGALVKATSSMGTNYEFEGEDALGSINGGTSSISFHNQGSFSGKKLTASKGYFYFSGGMYLNSKNLNISALGDALYVYPFRGYYSYEGGGTGNAKIMTAFNVLFGENEEATGITELAGEADLVAIPGRGTITFKAAADNDLQIVKANGMKVGRVVIGAGETQTVHVPAGLYIVNGAKLIVK